ncbi:hypothetical protein GCM10009826_13740 [Humibacillus xanthopallidus]
MTAGDDDVGVGVTAVVPEHADVSDAAAATSHTPQHPNLRLTRTPARPRMAPVSTRQGADFRGNDQMGQHLPRPAEGGCRACWRSIQLWGSGCDPDVSPNLRDTSHTARLRLQAPGEGGNEASVLGCDCPWVPVVTSVGGKGGR